MSDHTAHLRQRVQTIMPDLVITQVELNQEGLINDVAIVNQSLVFRFAKTTQYAEFLQNELKILDLIRDRVGVAVPTPIYRSHDTVVYPFLPGHSLTRNQWLALDSATQQRLAEQLGAFLYGLHTTSIATVDWEIPPTLAPVTYEKWVAIRQRVQEKVYPLLLKHQIQWAEQLFDRVLATPTTFDYVPVLIHGDLAPYHILWDDTKNAITGVIDFGVAGIGDAASDIGILITTYGEHFVHRMQNAYPGLPTYLPRARFYAQSIELQWVLLGLETGENFWFTAHIGGARDVYA